MPTNVLIYGNRLFTGKCDKLFALKPGLSQEITTFEKPTIPKAKAIKGTAYIDIENNEFCNPSFLVRLKKSFEDLRIVGISDSADENQTMAMAMLGVSEILTEKEYHSRISECLGNSQQEPNQPKATDNRLDISAIIGNSPQMTKIKKMIDHLRDVDYPNAIMFGETGTGKDLLAKVLHYSGVRKDCNFIEVNCSAIPDALFESELFGHKKGAFTDAGSDKSGLFEFADNGTIFLDEIGNLSLSAQAKLLKIVENRRLRPLGAVKDKEINVRVLAATNANLEAALAQNRFREDLLYRLNLIAIHLPPLRERKEDIPDLANETLNIYRTLYNRPTLTFGKKAIGKLMKHHWPGNVRELRNVIERAVLMTTSRIVAASQIDDAILNGRVSVSERRQITIEIPEQGKTLKEVERQVVGEILNMVGWNRTKAAEILKISRARLRRIMEESKLDENRRK